MIAIGPSTAPPTTGTSWHLWLDTFPADGVIRIDGLTEVMSINYATPDGPRRELDPSAYSFDPTTWPVLIALTPGAVWPETGEGQDAVNIHFRT
jgi:hypothetical protein